MKSLISALNAGRKLLPFNNRHRYYCDKLIIRSPVHKSYKMFEHEIKFPYGLPVQYFCTDSYLAESPIKALNPQLLHFDCKMCKPHKLHSLSKHRIKYFIIYCTNSSVICRLYSNYEYILII